MTTTTVASDAPPPRELFKLARDLERWRNRAPRGRRIPEELWAAAAGLARTYGVSRISAALKLNYYDLQRRARGRGALSPQPQAPPTFIEVPVPKASADLNSPSLLEVVHPGGARLLLRLSQARPVDLSALLQSFLDYRP